MPQGLPVSEVVQVDIILTPQAVGERNFGAMLLVGSSPVIDVVERKRRYTGLDAVADDFGVNAPEYRAARRHFAQAPRPSELYIGRWAQVATAGLLHGGILTPAQQLLSNFTSITNGSLTITVDGTVRTKTGINLSSATSLSQVAALVQSTGGALGGTVTWDAIRGRFDVTSATAGTSSSVAPAAVAGAGTDLGPLMRLTTATGASAVPGIAAESLLAGVQVLAGAEGDWYLMSTALASPPSDSDVLQVAAYIEGATPSRVAGYTTQDTAHLNPAASTGIGRSLAAARYKRAFVQYSGTDPDAAVSSLARASTVDFDGVNTVLTLKFKTLPGIVAETLTSSQASALKAANTNVFVNYANGAAIVQEGVMSSGDYFDEIQGLDWLANRIQTGLFNLFYTLPTKIAQTDDGVGLLVAQAEADCAQGVTNGLLAPGLWRGPSFGGLATNDMLTKGFYVWAPPIRLQSDADRAARRAPPITVAVKLAGAVHSSNVLINVNR